jgi:MYXO-CTERM domain-containing protein
LQRFRVWPIALAFCAVHAWAHADDEGRFGVAASLMPLEVSELFVKVESVEFVFVPEQRVWRASIQHQLASVAQHDVTLRLAVPEYHCSEESEFDDQCDASPGNFPQLLVTVRDRPLRLRRSAVPNLLASPALDALWLLPMRIAAGETVLVAQHVLVAAGQSSEGGFSATYRLPASAHWAKPVARASFRYSFPARSCLVIEPESLTRKSRRVVLRDSEPWLELVYEAYVWNPPNELSFYFEPCQVARDTEISGCPAASELGRFFFPPEGDEEVEPISQDALQAVLAKLSDQELERCRDGVFAAYAGYFQESELKKLPAHAESARHYTAPLLAAADWSWVHFLDGLVAQRTKAREARASAARAQASRAGKSHGCGCSTGESSRNAPGVALSLVLVLLVRRRGRPS